MPNRCHNGKRLQTITCWHYGGSIGGAIPLQQRRLLVAVNHVGGVSGGSGSGWVCWWTEGGGRTWRMPVRCEHT